MKDFLVLMFLMVGAMACSSSQVNDAKLSLAAESGRAVDGAFISISSKKLSNEKFVELSCKAEAKYYGEKVESKVQDILKADTSNVIASKKSLAGSACKAVMPIALSYAIDEADLKPCAKEIGIAELLKVGDLACEYVDEKF